MAMAPRTFKLVGISAKGKNRIRENGSLWEEHHTTSPLRSDQILVKSIETGNLRWINKHNDPDFEIKELV